MCLPAGQGRHESEEFAEDDGLYVPRGQDLQKEELEEDAFGLKVPGGQASHNAAADALKVPT